MTRGIYVLVISVAEDIRTKVGTLGHLHFRRGHYAYVGSAQNGIEERIRRHLTKQKRKFWHIDYLLGSSYASVKSVFSKEIERVEECRIAARLTETSEAVRSFGCSDCDCISHLFRFTNSDFLMELLTEERMISMDLPRISSVCVLRK